MKPTVWVTRPGAGGFRTRDALARAGFPVVHASPLEVALVDPSRFPPAPAPDWVILVSANAAAGLDRALTLPGFPALDPTTTRIAAVGRRTADVARDLGWSVSVVPSDERASGLIEALSAESLNGRRVWIPAGNREGSANRELPDHFRHEGATVSVFGVYETRTRALVETEERALQTSRPGAMLFHSPSAGDAVHSIVGHPEVQRWWQTAVLLAIGKVTARRLEALRGPTIAVCEEPSDVGVIAALGRLEVFRSARSQP